VRILIVEDEQRVVHFLERGFQAEGFAVDTASDGERGLFLAQTENYDVIILDIMLPKKSGLEILKQFRKEHVATPVLMLTAKTDLEDRLEGFDAGADDYVPKPFAFSEILARVRALLRRGGSVESTSSLTVADLRMDLLSRKVTRSGKKIDLTNKEFQLLEYLVRNQGRVLSRIILTEHIWDIQFDTDTNIVDVVINRLRRKIDDASDVKLIHTVRGVGYVLQSPDHEISE